MLQNSNPDVFWLNVTNIALGVSFVICLGLVAIGAIRDLLHNAQKPGRS